MVITSVYFHPSTGYLVGWWSRNASFLLLGNCLNCIFNGFSYFPFFPLFGTPLLKCSTPKISPPVFFFFFGSLIFYYFPYILEDFPCLSVCSLNPPNYFQDLTSVLDTSLRSLLIVHLRARTESWQSSGLWAESVYQALVQSTLLLFPLGKLWFQYIHVFPPGMFNVPRKMSHLLSES